VWNATAPAGRPAAGAATDLAAAHGSGYLTSTMRLAVFAVAFALLCPIFAARDRPARADVTHVVEAGHTLESIAHRYHVSPQAIVAANHLKEGEALHPGQTLVIPGADAKDAKDAKDPRDAKAAKIGTKDAKTGAKATGPKPAPRTAARGGAATARAPRARFERNVIHAVRFDEEFKIRVKDARGKIPSSALISFERLMRQGEGTHPPDPRLVAMIGVVSNHFDGRTIEVVSGFRAYTPTQYTPHSNHNLGRALDFRIEGIPNEELRDFCRTLRSTGCGYYPNSTFVHLDVRDAKAYWVDLSHPGEPPRYEKLGVYADEGTSDVTTESH
jgi:uncharacterized protein YcbK (DUF882 family)